MSADEMFLERKKGERDGQLVYDVKAWSLFMSAVSTSRDRSAQFTANIPHPSYWTAQHNLSIWLMDNLVLMCFWFYFKLL